MLLLILEAVYLGYNQYVNYKRGRLIEKLAREINASSNITNIDINKIKKEYDGLRPLVITFNNSKAVEYDSAPMSKGPLFHSDLAEWCANASGLAVDILVTQALNDNITDEFRGFFAGIGEACKGIDNPNNN